MNRLKRRYPDSVHRAFEVRHGIKKSSAVSSGKAGTCSIPEVVFQAVMEV